MIQNTDWCSNTQYCGVYKVVGLGIGNAQYFQKRVEMRIWRGEKREVRVGILFLKRLIVEIF